MHEYKSHNDRDSLLCSLRENLSPEHRSQSVMKYRFEAYDVEQILNGYLACNDNLVTQSFVQESKERHD